MNIASAVSSRSLRIGIFTNGFPISSEPFIALQAAELVRRGHDVTVFGMSNVQPSSMTSSQDVASRLAGRYASAHWPEDRLARLGAAIAATARTMRKVGVARSPLFRPLIFRRTWRDLSAVFQADLVAGQPPFDILHCQFATLAEHVVKLCDAGLLSGRLVVHFRGYDITEVVRAAGPKIYDGLWSRADRFIANCDHFRDLAVGIGCPADRIDVVGSGIDLRGFVYRAPNSPGRGPLRLIAIGRLTDRKGFHTLIDAVSRMVAAGRDCQLTIVGDGQERKSLEARACALGLAERVEFTGMLTHCAISDRLADAHIFVAPSQTSAKGGLDAPTNTIKEAMAVGVPVCASRHGGMPELVEDGVTGTLAREADPADLVSAIERLLSLAPEWPGMTRAARARVEDRYAIDLVTDKLLSSYQRATGDLR